MSNYWTDRALPVLSVLASHSDPHMQDGLLMLGFGRGAKLGLELSDAAFEETIMQLGDAGYVEFSPPTYEIGGGVCFSDLHVTGRGMQVLGQWPRFELLVSPLTFAALLEALAEYAAPEAGALKHAAYLVRRVAPSVLKSLAIGVGSQLVRNAVGLR